MNMIKIKNLFTNKKMLASIGSLVLGLVVSSIVIGIMGYNPFDILSQLFTGAFGTNISIWKTLNTWTIFSLLGLSVAIGFKAGLFNIGTAGQMLFGSMAGYMVAYNLNLSTSMTILVIVLLALILGGIYSLIAAALKTMFGVNEVVSTIMLNWVAVKLAKGFLEKGLIQPDQSNLATLPTGVTTSVTSISPYISWVFFVAIISIFAIWALLRFTKLGLKIKVIGMNFKAGDYSGYKSKSIVMVTFAISGLLAGFAGLAYYFGEYGHEAVLSKSHFEAPAAMGFTGITIALLALNNPLGVAVSAILFAAIQGDAALDGMDSTIPREIGNLFSSIIVYFVAALNIFILFLTPTKIKHVLRKAKKWYKDTTISLSVKISFSIFNILSIGALAHANRNYKWIKTLKERNFSLKRESEVRKAGK